MLVISLRCSLLDGKLFRFVAVMAQLPFLIDPVSALVFNRAVIYRRRHCIMSDT